MKKKEVLTCKRCGEFIGVADNLEECPICGKELNNREAEDE